MRRITAIGLGAVVLVGALALDSQSAVAANNGTTDGTTKTNSKTHHRKHHHKKHHGSQKTITQKKSY